MTGSRESVLGAIRGALGRDSLPDAAAETVRRRLERPTPNMVPMRGLLALAERIDLFVEEAERVNTTTARLGHLNQVPSAITDYLKGVNLPASLRVAPDPVLRNIPWADEPLLEITTGPAREGDKVSVTGAFAGVAETGTLVLLSGSDSPTTLNFMPDAHIVVLPVDRVVGTYEEVWARVRARFENGILPRAVNWITGPSRTGDIEQTLLLGAHGPRLLHVLLVDV
jgi:L-lactate dehydrogenase complex protein LldG